MFPFTSITGTCFSLAASTLPILTGESSSPQHETLESGQQLIPIIVPFFLYIKKSLFLCSLVILLKIFEFTE
ncbi:hypothetical protein JO40_10940 [Treponema putidum]|nr:hypothetical protein JO40_10940 [Treponema putidum]